MIISSRLVRGVSTCGCCALLAACGGAFTQTTSVPALHATGTSAMPSSRSWMRAKAESGDLLYISSPYPTGEVQVFSYPQGKLVGMLSGFDWPWGLCSDSSGDVFIVDAEAQDIVEYAHGGTSPIATLNDAGNDPNGCAVDPATGNLAVAGGGRVPSTVMANIAIYQDARGSPSVYTSTVDYVFYYCTYDEQGNVFASANYFDSADFNLTELPEGGSKFIYMRVSQVKYAGGAIQWDGRYLALGSPSHEPHGPATIYQIQVSGSTPTIVNTIKLSTKQDTNSKGGDVGFWIQAGKIVSPESYNKRIGIWRYPSGGEAAKTINDHRGLYPGVTVSVDATKMR